MASTFEVGSSENENMIGSGYNNFTGQIANNMLKNVKTITEPIGKNRTKVHICESVEEVMHALNIGVTAEGSGFGVTLENKFSFAQEASSSTTSVTVLFLTSQVSKSITASSADFNDVAQATTASDLFRRGGDSFICNEVYGAQFCASLEFVCYDASQTRTVSDEIKATYNDGAISGSASASMSVKDFEKKNGVTCNITFFSTGYGELNMKDLTDVKAIIDFASALSGRKVEAPAVLYRSTRSYNTLADPPTDWKVVEDRRTALMVGDGSESSPGYQTIRNTAYTAREKLRTTRQIYAFYGQQDIDERFKTIEASLTSTINAIAQWKSSIASAPTSTSISNPVVDIDSIKIPTLKFDYQIAPNPRGGPGGNAFSDVGPELIPACIYLKKINWRSGTWIDQITFTYGFASGGRPDLKMQHGNSDGGIDRAPIVRTEYSNITSMSYWNCDNQWHNATTAFFMFMDSVSGPKDNVAINRQPGCEGPFLPTATFQKGPDEKTKAFVGWAGRESDYLDAIMPIWATFKKPDWARLEFPKKF